MTLTSRIIDSAQKHRGQGSLILAYKFQTVHRINQNKKDRGQHSEKNTDSSAAVGDFCCHSAVGGRLHHAE
jgi:hypothetical protein